MIILIFFKNTAHGLAYHLEIIKRKEKQKKEKKKAMVIAQQPLLSVG